MYFVIIPITMADYVQYELYHQNYTQFHAQSISQHQAENISIDNYSEVLNENIHDLKVNLNYGCKIYSFMTDVFYNTSLDNFLNYFDNNYKDILCWFDEDINHSSIFIPEHHDHKIKIYDSIDGLFGNVMLFGWLSYIFIFIAYKFEHYSSYMLKKLIQCNIANFCHEY